MRKFYLFIGEYARANDASGGSMENMNSSPLCDGDWNIHNVHGLLFRTIDHGEASFQRIYPADGSRGAIADNKKANVFAYLEEFVDKLQSKDVKIAMITCGRGLSWLAGDADVIGDKLRRFSRMAGCFERNKYGTIVPACQLNMKIIQIHSTNENNGPYIRNRPFTPNHLSSRLDVSRHWSI
ncbi:hypothetical protein ACHAXN_005425 [Cyclotella atomus]|jgi:hypothetical protein